MTRKRPLIHLSLSPDAIARLREIAARSGESCSSAVERLVREAEMPRSKRALNAEKPRSSEDGGAG
jgi:hypothetical protein